VLGAEVPIGGPTPPAGSEGELFGAMVVIIGATAAGKGKPK
jgi:hypothetical protein